MELRIRSGEVTRRRLLRSAGFTLVELMIVMAIIGGAALTALMGLISDSFHSIALAMLVPAGCFAVVALFSTLHLRDPATL